MARLVPSLWRGLCRFGPSVGSLMLSALSPTLPLSLFSSALWTLLACRSLFRVVFSAFASLPFAALSLTAPSVQAHSDMFCLVAAAPA